MPQSTNIWFDLDTNGIGNGTQITGWTSSVNNVAFTNSAKGPIMDATSLRFFGTNRLVLAGATPPAGFRTPTNCFAAVIMDTNGAPALWRTLIGDTSGEFGIMIGLSGFWRARVLTGSKVFSGDVRPATNHWVDIIWTGGNGANASFYTNGILSTTLAQANDNWTFSTVIGNNQGDPGADYWYGYIMRFIWWTNTASAGLTSIDVSNIHNYFTNRYKYSP